MNPVKVAISFTLDVDPAEWFKFDLGSYPEGRVNPSYVREGVKEWVEGQVTMRMQEIGLIQ